VILPFLVGLVVVLALVPLGTLCAVPLAQSGELLGGFGFLIDLEVTGRSQVGVDLIEISGEAASLLLGLFAAYGRHVGERSCRETGRCGDGAERRVWFGETQKNIVPPK
jgi:hypothetical protein